MTGNLYTILILCFALAVLLQCSVATNYTVGDSNGWNIPSDSSAYQKWAAGKTFIVGDVLVFNFPTGAHDVAEVTKSGYDGCNINSPITLETTGPASITLTSSGEKYYICTIGSHCSLGMKLGITVSSSTPSSPPPPPATPPPVASFPPPASPPPPPPATTPPPVASSPTPPSPPPMTSTPPPASPPPMASSPLISPPTVSTPVPAVAPLASTPAPAKRPSPPPKFHAPAPTPSSSASPRSSATSPNTSPGSSPSTSDITPSTTSTVAPPPSSAISLGVTSLFTGFLMTAAAVIIQQIVFFV